MHRNNDEDISPADWARVDEAIATHKGTPGALITVLRLCQDVVGWFPPTLISHVAEKMGIAESEVFGVVSFYSLFSLKPKGRHTIRVCKGTACYVKGAAELLSQIHLECGIREGEVTPDKRFGLEAVRCLGACGLAPALVVGRDTHGGMTPDKVASVLKKYS